MAEGRKPGKKELKDEAKLDLPPMAFTKQGSMWVWIDAQARTLMLDTDVQDHADEVAAGRGPAQLHPGTAGHADLPTGALLHKTVSCPATPDPRHGYATATVCRQPSSVNRFRMAARMCSSLTCRSNVRDITRSPSRLMQFTLISTRLHR